MSNKEKHLSNEEFVSHLMRFSQYGALTRVFVIEAIRYYSEQVSSTPEPKDDPRSPISPTVWHRIAVDIKKAMDENYASSTPS